MKYLALIPFLFLTTFCWAQITLEGKVIHQGDSLALPGVMVSEDSLNVTSTDAQGQFSLTVEELPTTLTFEFIGLLSRTVKIESDSSIEVMLKERVNVCYLGSQQIGAYAKSGLINSPLGGELYLRSPFFLRYRLLEGAISYQTDLEDNKALYSSLSIPTLFAIQYFSFGLSSSFQKVSLDQTFAFSNKGIALELGHPYSPVDLSVGYSALAVTDIENTQTNYKGIKVNIEDYYFRHLRLEMSAAATFYDDLIGYQFEVSRTFPYIGIHTFIQYQSLDSYQELSVGVGYQMTYRFSNPNKY